jgi:head-tail adaptor
MAKREMPFSRSTPLDAGERDRAVTVQQLTDSTGTSGFPVETWTTLASPVWMRKLDLGIRERFMTAQLAAAVDTQWEMGYRADMDPELVDVTKVRRLVYQGRIHDITSADEIGRREGISLLTIAGAKVGA